MLRIQIRISVGQQIHLQFDRGFGSTNGINERTRPGIRLNDHAQAVCACANRAVALALPAAACANRGKRDVDITTGEQTAERENTDIFQESHTGSV